MSSIAEEAWLRSESPCEVASSGDQPICKIWFKKRVDRDFCFRVTQIQLCTDSHDRNKNPQDIGGGESESRRDWTWFEIAILADEDSTEPKISKEGKPLVWASHSNRRANSTSQTRHFGAIFDRRCELLVNLEVGDIIAVRVGARFPGSVNYADKGYLLARVLDQDLFTPHRWTLSSDILPTHEEQVEDGSYSFVAPTTCLVKSEGNELSSQIWFTTPALDDETIRKLESVQLFTYSRYQEAQQEAVPDGDRFSWFDFVILETPFHTVPRVENGVSLVWKSHANEQNTFMEYPYHGQRYDVEDETNRDVQMLAIALKGALKAGNAIGIRVNAQYPGWENYARAGQIIMRISNEVAAPIPTILPGITTPDAGLEEFRKSMEELGSKGGYKSATASTLTIEARADVVLTAPAEPVSLRLLSIDGGGVRGVSPLRTLKRIMARVADLEKKPRIKPCEYFDMIAGTSTGGLIALMLGRLEMTIEECEECYDEISEKVFGHKAGYIFRDKKAAFLGGTYLYKPQPLIDAVKAIVCKKLGDPEALLMDPKKTNPRCKVMLMTALASKVENAKTGIHLRSYLTSDLVPSESDGWTIWEAARATSAAPVYFPKFKRGKLTFVDGGLGFNNPAWELYCELPALYSRGFNLDCLLSLGTGTPPDMHLGDGLNSIEDFIAIATNTETIHDSLVRAAVTFPKFGVHKYWRFNMNKEMSGNDWVEKAIRNWRTGWFEGKEKLVYDQVMVEMDDWMALNLIRKLTDKWLDHGKADILSKLDQEIAEGPKAKKVSIGAQIDQCAKRIVYRV